MAENESKKIKYHFLTGENPVRSEEFNNDAEAVAAAKKDKKVLRVQSMKTMGYIYEAGEKEAPASEEKSPASEEKKAEGKK